MPNPSVKKLSAFAHFTLSRRSIPVFKAVLGYILGFVLIFLRKFDALSKFPATLTAITIVLIAGGTGKAVGACVQSIALAMVGIGCGSVCFIILAKLVHAPVAQGFVFFAFVYVFALIKARGLKWFALALLAILMSFNGIYTSILVGKFEPAYLEEYIKAYCWGGAIVLTVNVLVFPISSERELRRTLVVSLEHISTFSHLLAKGYTLTMTEEERSVRDQLAQSIRADFGFLSQKIEETSVEINYSRFSMNDYQDFVARTRAMQLALITVYSSQVNVEKKDLDLFKTEFLPSTIRSFTHFRRAIETTMRETCVALGGQPLDISSTQPGYAEFMDLEERIGTDDPKQLSRQTTGTGDVESVDARLNSVAQRLAEEVGDGSSTAGGTGSVHTPTAATTTPGSANRESAVDADEDGEKEKEVQSPTSPSSPAAPNDTQQGTRSSTSTGICVRTLRRLFNNFSADQHKILTKVIVSGKMHGEDDSLRQNDPLPSLSDMYQYRVVPVTDSDAKSGKSIRRRRGHGDESGYDTPAAKNGEAFYEIYREKTHHEKKSAEMATASHHSLTRVYSFLFAMEQFVGELEQLYKATRWCASKRRLHIHLFESLHRPHHKSLEIGTEDEMGVPEAVALLEHKPYTRPKKTIWQRWEQLELWFRSPNSIFAAKTAAAVTIYAVLILHPVPRPWFISFGLTGGALTIVTALTPTLGQSLLTFILQILGSGFGYIWAVILLYIFRDVGGYRYNPYGIIALLVPYAFGFMYMLYEKPQFFVAALLALNGTGTVLIVEWINVEYLHNVHYDSPILRMGKAFTTLGIALGLVATFQLFILRNPARRTLRKRIGAMLFGQLSYATLLQAYGRAAMPTETDRAPDVALRRVERELRHRELKLQAELIDLRPLVAFAAAEPQPDRPFRADIINSVLRTSQVILDRLRESRTAVGTKPIPDVLLNNFTKKLAPYRRRNTQVIQLAFFLVASSVLSKSALPKETPAELAQAGQVAHLMHDILVLASQYAQTEEGLETIRSGEFTRYFHFIMCISSILEHLKTIEESCKDLFGVLEDKLL
ncbi:hypothetical protein BD410DRAFT_783138 [Rickenella mellea]|uniref:Uncharacterized protein n=1 Tax=Rickenella mellea TaxID=50990 RepID=A0A4Y7QID2_9AGAM|nr:hypothetical protein BD410DRAFT_783138 [Rickenella mellea]